MPVQTEHKNHFGIEVVSGVTWKGWEPGGEYTKQIVLKNVQIKTQKLKYKVPSTRFFTTLYPKPIMLSSGTSFVLPVTFRPLEKGPYEDYLEFEANEGSFSVPMRAVLPSADIAVPETLTFGLCAVKDSMQVMFEVTNNSELVTAFHWEVAEPFSLQPTSGTLAPKTSCSITATFNPKAALVYEGVAVCKYGAGSEKGLTKHTRIEGIGRFPHLVAALSGRGQTASEASNQVLVNFGEVPVQTTEEKWINLHNFSPVSAPFQVLQPSSAVNIDTVFSCSQYHGVVAPQSTAKIKMSFSPHTPGTLSTDLFEVVALGATNCSVIKCVGTGKGASVELDSSFLDFGVLESGKQFNRTFKITNTSSVSAAFQFMIDCDQSVFKLDTVCGVLAGNSSQTIIAHFKPAHPINYYRKLTCLVQNQDPLFMDLFGTCHTELVKPAVLQKKHLERYNVHVKRGFSKTAPEQLNELLREKKLHLDEEGAVVSQETQSISCELQLNQNLSPMEEFFDGSLVGETTCTMQHVSLDVRHLDFGRTPDARAVEQKTINITNHTKGKITCTWMKDCRGIFSVSPEELDILPLRTASFRVTFRPDAANQFFSAELECYAFYKSMRDYRLVEDNTLCPPWCLTLKSSGHTFTMGTETFIPRCQWDAKHLVFPAVIPNQLAYKTLLLTNMGPNPIQFDFPEDPSGIFTCQPSKGLLRDKYQLVVFRMAPPEAKPFKHTVKCQLNEAQKFTEEIHLTGSAEIPQVQFDIKGPLYFKPTCLGSASTRILAVKNSSRIPLWFQWSIAGSDAKVLNVAQSEGMILPNDVQFHEFTFTPLEETKYLAKAKLHVKSSAVNDTSLQSERKYVIRAIGEGARGSIVCTEPLVDLGDVIVGSSVSRSLTIHNNSNCSLQYDLLVDQDVQGPYDDEGSVRDVLALELDSTTGVIPSGTSQQIDVVAFPTRRVTYTFRVSYKLLSTTNDGKQYTTRQKTPLTELRCQGVYPTLSVSDVRCLGSGKSFSKVQLWKLFSLDSFNECLDADPSPSELMYAAATRHSTTRRVPVYTRAIMDFNFSAAPIGGEPCIIHLNLQNTGTVPAEWAFLYPSDLQLELEYWAETGEYSEEELHEMQVMDNKLFTVEPKNGILAPGQSTAVVLSYRHLFIGTNKLPVLFKVSRGREILLNFIGVTVDPDSYYVHFANTKHMFEPVPIGSTSPPVQVYELYNGGAQTVKYELDLEPLAQVEAANYGCRVLECLNPTGEIPPGCSAPIHWVFAPLEARTYMVDIPVHILGGDTVLVTFTGVGYDQRIMGSTMPFRETASAVPGQQQVQLTQQLAKLSVERIALGNIPLFSISHQVFVLTNNSKEQIISFRWILEGTQNVIMIEPYHGYLRPQQDVLLKISFFSCMAPSLYDLDIVCEIVNETKMAEYNQKMIDWTNRQEEKQYTFTITEADVKAEKKPDKRPHSGPRLASLTKSQQAFSKSEGDLRKYNALPPIGSPGKGGRRKANGEQTDPQPTPPEAFLLHLGVTARTHSIAEFYQNFSSSVDNFFIDQRYVVSQGRGSTQQTEQLAALASCSKEELDVTASVMSVILRGLLDDDGFQRSLDDVAKEPVPYFRQLCESPYPSSRPASAETNGSRRSRSPSDLEPTDDDLEFEPELDFGHQQTPPELSEDKVITRIHETAQRPPSSALSMADKLSEEEGNQEMRLTQRQAVRSLPEFESMVEAVLENTLCNILMEANRGEVNLTARPRVIALPPSRINRTAR